MTKRSDAPQIFTVFGGAYVQESHSFGHALRSDATFVWGVVLAGIVVRLTAVTALTAAVWSNNGLI